MYVFTYFSAGCLGVALPYPIHSKPCPVPESLQKGGFSPWDAWDHAYSCFARWFSPFPRPQTTVLFIKPGLSILNLAWFDWLCQRRGLISGYGNLSLAIEPRISHAVGKHSSFSYFSFFFNFEAGSHQVAQVHL